jgi:hypothetical protein
MNDLWSGRLEMEMTRASQISSLIDSALKSVAHLRQQERQLGSEPAEGGVYLFPEPEVGDFRWLVVMVESGEYYVVPADGDPLAGRYDLHISGVGCQDLVARCGFGCWLGEQCFRVGQRVANVQQVLPALRDRILATSVGAPLPELEEEVEANPTYREWCAVVARGVHELIADLTRRGLPARKGQVLELKDELVRRQREAPSPDEQLREMMAEVTSLRARLAATTKRAIDHEEERNQAMRESSRLRDEHHISELLRCRQIDEIEELKAKVAELTRQLAEARGANPPE